MSENEMTDKTNNGVSNDILFKKYKAGRVKDSNRPCVSFDITKRLRGLDGKRCKDFLYPQIERLSSHDERRRASIRFADVLLANLLEAYRSDTDIPSGVVLVQRKESVHSIQFMGMRKISKYVVRDVLKWLKDNGYIRRIRPNRHSIEELDADGKRVGLEWVQERSALYIATDKLNDLMTGDLQRDQPKICKGCGNEKPVLEYPRQRDGYEATCKSCRAESKRIARAKSKKAA